MLLKLDRHLYFKELFTAAAAAPRGFATARIVVRKSFTMRSTMLFEYSNYTQILKFKYVFNHSSRCLINLFYFSRRRKSFQPFGGGDHCQGGHPRELSEAGRPPKHHFVGNANPAIDCATPTHLSHTLGPVKPRQVIHQGHAVTSLMNNGHTTTRCLANHYIPDHHKMMTLDNHVVMQRKQVIADEFRQRFGPVPERRNVMELSERPPVPVPTAVYQMADYPHIVIGGKPFYLIPSSDTILQVEAGGSESYAYPQHMPIYEEIDYNTVMGAAPTMLSSSGSSARPGVMDRPLSSAASHSNSAHTNTSELSSVGSNSSSSQKMDDHNLSGGHLVVNPQHCTPTHRSLRLADGLERSRSPQSIYSARLVNQQQQQQNNKPSSVYYYSDTLKTKNSRNYANDDITALDDSCCDEDTKVNTRVILEDATAVKNGSTLV